MIIPAILEKNWEEIEKKLEICRSFANTIHIDFIDGKFADNSSFLEFEPFKKYSEYFFLEAHLMVEEPVNYLDRLSSAGFKRFLGHVEEMSDQVEFVAKGEQLGAVGLALDIETPTSDIKVSLEDLDQILLMSVIAGRSGQEFDKIIIPKIEELRDKGFANIEIDGGINNQTLPLAKNAGANMFCVTSFLFKDNPEEQFRILSSV
mgnify:CR=1 FL=1